MKKLILIAVCGLYSSVALTQNTDMGIQGKNNENQNANTDKGYQEYINKVGYILASNDIIIDDMKIKLQNKNRVSYKKYEKTVASLNIENKELKTDLNDYIQYGCGDWKLFKKEFNVDLAYLGRDLDELHQIFSFDDLIADNIK